MHYIRVYHKLRYDLEINDTSYYVLAYIVLKTNNFGDCDRTQKTISHDLYIGERTVKRAYKDLIAKKLIEVCGYKEICATKKAIDLFKEHDDNGALLHQEGKEERATLSEKERATLTHKNGPHCHLERANMSPPNKTIKPINLSINSLSEKSEILKEEQEDFEDAIEIPLNDKKEDSKKKKVPRKKEKEPMKLMMQARDSITNYLKEFPDNIDNIIQLSKVKTKAGVGEALTSMCAFYCFDNEYMINEFVSNPAKGAAKLMWWCCNQRQPKIFDKKTKRQMNGGRHTKATGAKVSTEYEEAMKQGKEVFKSFGLNPDGEWRKFMKNKN